MSLSSITILYATESGNSEDLAKRTQEKIEELGAAATVCNVSDYSVENLAQEVYIVFIASTWGDGDPPEEAIDFDEALDTVVSEKSLDLSNTSFCVLALGDTDYELFCHFGKKLDQSLESLGAKRLIDRVDLDVDFEEKYEEWIDNLVDCIKKIN